MRRWCGRVPPAGTYRPSTSHTRLERPAQTDALAAWLAQHGALLEELKLCMDSDVDDTAELEWQAAAAEAHDDASAHPVVRLLERVPGTLKRLDLSSAGDDPVAAEEAAALACAFSSQQPMQPPSLALPLSWQDHAATVQPALEALLSQLTNLVLWCLMMSSASWRCSCQRSCASLTCTATPVSCHCN